MPRVPRHILILIMAIFLPTQLVYGDVLITSIGNISFGSWSGSGDLQDQDGVCIYNDSGSSYQLTAIGSGGGGAFELSSGGNPPLSYGVEFRGSSGSFTTLNPGNPDSFSSADQSSTNCGGSTNATFRVTITQAALRGAVYGSYSGTLTLLLEP